MAEPTADPIIQTTYNDGLCPGGRRPLLWIVKEGTIHTFAGVTIPGVVVVHGTTYSKNGKWSSTTYTLAHRESVREVYLLAPLHGRTWNQPTLAEGLAWLRERAGQDVSEEEFRAALARDNPVALERWDATASELESL